ncbi:hypothetical protein MMC17_006066 [Xylographa soralifera]|nr:hypothetical protein [Xylographa soralifera]
MEQLRLAQNIFILQALNETPVPPSENSIDHYAASHSFSPTRVLSLVHERRLVEILTYWASSSDDPRKVIALCVEEEKNGKGMIVRLAVNHGNLDQVNASFNAMKVTLEEAAASNGALLGQYLKTLRRQIADLNQNRILARLRSRHARFKANLRKRKEARRKLAPWIMELAEQMMLTSSPLTAKTRQHLYCRVKAFHEMFITLETMSETQVKSKEGVDALLVITQCAHQIATDFPLKDVLSRLPSITPDIASLMCRDISKLGYYYSVPQELIQAVSRHNIFKAITVEVVKYAPNTKATETTEKSQSSGVVERLQSVIDSKTNLLNNEYLGRTDLLAQINQYKELQSQLQCLDCSKYPVHAEIQLLAHYELRPSKLAPRVISSSKKACYLCNLFFRYHGKYFIANSHGRMYEKWALPEDFDQLGPAQAAHITSVIRQFEGEVERAAAAALRTGRRRLYEYPNESIVLKSIVWSLISRISKKGDHDTSERKVLPKASSNHSKQEESRMPLGQSDRVSRNPSKRTASSSPNRRSVKISEPASGFSTSYNIIPIASSSKLLDTPHHLYRSNSYRPFTKLRHGVPVNTKLSPLEPIFHAGTPDIHLLLSSDSPETLELQYQIGIKLLPIHEQRVDLLPLIVDIGTMSEGEDVVVEGNSIIMQSQGAAISIEYVLQSQIASLSDKK